MPQNLKLPMTCMSFGQGNIWCSWTKLNSGLVLKITMFGLVNEYIEIVLHKIKYLNLRYSEGFGSCQDGLRVAHARWRLVGPAKICGRRGVWRVGIVPYRQVWTSSKRRSVIWICPNCSCIILIFQWSFKWREIFFISQWINEGPWSLFGDTCITCYNVNIMF